MRFVALLSGGIDSPVSAHLTLEKGLEAFLLNMDNRPFAMDEEYDKVDRIASRLQFLHPGMVRLFRAPFGSVLSAALDGANPRYRCVLCKMAMLRMADLLCEEWDCSLIVMGDSLGQVASQTLPNIAAVSAGVRHPIIRPLIGYDKLDIEAVAKDIGTYDISKTRTVGCTAAPRFPITKADHHYLKREAEKAGLEGAVRKAAEGVIEVDILNTMEKDAVN